MSKILTFKEVKKIKLNWRSYANGDYSYATADGFQHLIRDGIDLLDGLEAVECHLYVNEDCEYATADGKIFYIINKPRNKPREIKTYFLFIICTLLATELIYKIVLDFGF